MSTTIEHAREPSARAVAAEAPSYSQALKSTASIGGASVVNILLGIIRTKFVAVILGPSGVGLLGAYTSITALISTVAGLGIQSSGVRQIAEAAGREDTARISVAIAAVRRTTLLLGILGAVGMLALAPWLSAWTFGNGEHTVALAILSLTILFGCISGGQVALLQGTRRIGDLAKVNVIGALLGTAVSVPLVWRWGVNAIVPFLLAVSAMAIVTTWWFARRVPIRPARLSWTELYANSVPLLRLGAALMFSSLLGMVVAYLLRLLILRQLGMEAAGHYQAAATLASIYVGFVLSAMGADFYPRLTAVAEDRRKMARMINEQAEIALLLAAPGVLATLALTPLVIRVFYSAAFMEAVELLRWQALGVLLRVIAWPLGYAILAKGNGKVFVGTELLAHGLHCTLIWIGLRSLGLVGTGMAFFAMYLVYWAVVYAVVRKLTGFGYSAACGRMLAIVLPASAITFLVMRYLPMVWATAISLAFTVVLGIYSVHTLATLAPGSRPARWWRSLVKRCFRQGGPP